MNNQRYQVSIQHDRSIRDMIHSALEDLGGVYQLIPQNRRVLIKPNLVIAKTNDTGATTNPLVIAELIQEVLKTNPAEVALGESSTAGDDTMKAFRITGMDDIARKYGVKIIDFKKGPQVVKEVPQGKEVRTIKVALSIFEYDYLINVPVLKIHGEATVTIGMKNLKGCIHDQEKHRFHRLNLHQCIVDLNTLIHPDLTVVDATTCALHWELGGDPVRLNTIIMSENVLAADMIAASLLGYGIDDVKHLKIASESGLGPGTMAEIKVYNPLNTEMREKIRDASREKGPEYKLPALKIIERGTCSSCKGALVAAMRRLCREGYSPACTVVMGQLAAEENEELEQAKRNGIPIIGMGHCGTKVVEDYSEQNIKDCPVRAEQVYGILKKFARR
jgi:uncharacterized protein (DUF362 family)